MDCLKPLQCWQLGTICCKTDGVQSPQLFFSYAKAFEYASRLGLGYLETVSLLERSRRDMACGKCEACLIRKRKDMSVRLSHETACHDDCCFVTLTYNDENVPYRTFDGEVGRGFITSDNCTLLPSDVQKFIKRLRRHLEYVPKKSQKGRDHVTKPIRYFAVGEYGSKTHRPHYHIMIFGWKPSDQVIHQVRNGYTINRSAQIEKLWKYGFSTVADVNHGVAKYCARYVTKKFARLAEKPLDPFVIPEFTLQSVRGGGIGSLWLSKYSDNLRNGYVYVRNGERITKCAIPRYYYDRLRKIRLPLWLELRDERINFLKRNKSVYDFDAIRRKVDVHIETYKYQITKEQI